MKNVKTPKQRIFFHCAALKILEIRQDSCEFLPCPAKKSLAVGHSAIYQTSPRMEHDQYGRVQAHAGARSESVNGFINRAIREAMKRDNGVPGPSGGRREGSVEE